MRVLYEAFAIKSWTCVVANEVEKGVCWRVLWFACYAGLNNGRNVNLFYERIALT